MRISALAVAFLKGLATLALLMLLAAIGIYSYQSTGGFLVISWLMIEFLACLLFGMGLFVCLFPPNHGDMKKLLGASILLFVYFYVLNDFSIYLAAYWRVDLPASLRENLLIPSKAVRASLQFASDLLGAVTGYRPQLIPPMPPAETSPGPIPSDMQGSAVLSWIGESVWNVVLGVVATFIAAWLVTKKDGAR